MCDKNSLFSATATAVDSAIVNFTGNIVTLILYKISFFQYYHYLI